MNMTFSTDKVSTLSDQYTAVQRADEAIFYLLLTNYLQPEQLDSFFRAARLLSQTGRRREAAELIAGKIKAHPGELSLRKAFCEITNWSDDEIDAQLPKIQSSHLDEFFYVRRCGSFDAPLSLWLCGFTDKIEANLTSSFVNNSGHDLLIACLPKLRTVLKLDINRIVYALCLDLRPKTVILFSCGLTQVGGNVTPAILGFAKEKLNFGLAALWIDMAKPLSSPLLRSYAPFTDAMAACDAQIAPHVAATYPSKCLNLWHVVNETELADRSEPKDIDVSFVGQITGNYEDRQPYIRRLEGMGVEHFVAGPDHGRYISHDKYAEVMRRSKIILNFSKFAISSIWDRHPVTKEYLSGGQSGDHVKGRVYEILHAGAVLLETANNEIAKVLTPGATYVPFTTPDDMEKQIRDLLADDEKQRRIGEAGRALAQKEFTSANFWKKIFGTIEQNRPNSV